MNESYGNPNMGYAVNPLIDALQKGPVKPGRVEPNFYTLLKSLDSEFTHIENLTQALADRLGPLEITQDGIELSSTTKPEANPFEEFGVRTDLEKQVVERIIRARKCMDRLSNLVSYTRL